MIYTSSYQKQLLIPSPAQLAMQQRTGGQEAKQTFLESKPPVAPWVSKEG